MTAGSPPRARVVARSRRSLSSSRTWAARLLPALAVACALAACGDDDATTASQQADDAPRAQPSDAPLAQAVTASPAAVETPARPLAQTDANASIHAAAPLATPVIHTVD
ncbi:hypothetical protein C7405_11939 [Paraburkholderia caballeronis]|uniref:hypothetical protein n=1 Tax=Paraburkholderia caballeronis TaxID=416943 RepID=UPI0010D50966|nr:hypothetical protein [Paraburkholderia caballeronis]TDV26732.1 hypothetical protein C7405_11939 [Paraburkholderia caballeronis]